MNVLSDLRPWILLVAGATVINALVVVETGDLTAYTLSVVTVSMILVFGIEGLLDGW